MIIKVRTINELTGIGYEILVDVDTRSIVLARFYDGNFIRSVKSNEGNTDETISLVA